MSPSTHTRCAWCGAQLEPNRDPRAEHCDHICRRRDWGERTGYDHQGPQKALQMRSNALPLLPGMRPTARAVYALLRLRGDYGATTAELCQPGVGGIKFGSRISDLRAAGCVITCQQLASPGRWRYWLRHDAFADVAMPDGLRQLAAVPSDQRVLDLQMPHDAEAA